VYRLWTEDLGIDGLCLLQDSIDDWRHEGSQMARVYQEAFVTLAAVLSEDSFGGLFVDADTNYVAQNTIVHINGEKSSRCTTERCWITELICAPFDGGWAFQERLLSPRVLLFEKNEIWWESRESIHCECLHIAQDKEYERDRSTLAYGQLRNSGDTAMIQLAWEELVIMRYSRLSLTKPGDIFLALQGLTKVVPQTMGSYLAGRWSATLIHSLTWNARSRLIHE